jgi:LPXTG-site transpeptidase (sortase) family protein
MLDRILSDLPPIDPLALAAGLIAGIAILLLIRAQQVWQHRQVFGYDVYAADTLRHRLAHWARITALIVAVIAVVYLWQTWRPLPVTPTLQPQAIAAAERSPLEGMQIVIPSLGLELDVIEAPLVARQWDISRLTDQVAHLSGTAYPGQPGNAVLAGHVTIPGAGWGPFKELDTLQPDDFIFIEREGETTTYEVIDNRLVEATAIEVVFPTDDQRLTLITCSGWDSTTEQYTHRVIVVARLVP